jgi:hypothetical protein
MINNFNIKLSNPISSGFCKILTYNKNINLNSRIKDSFGINTVSIERKHLQKCNSTLFILNSAESKELFKLYN